MVEVHPDPERALSDGPQSLRPDDLSALVKDVNKILNTKQRNEPC